MVPAKSAGFLDTGRVLAATSWLAACPTFWLTFSFLTFTSLTRPGLVRHVLALLPRQLYKYLGCATLARHWRAGHTLLTVQSAGFWGLRQEAESFAKAASLPAHKGLVYTFLARTSTQKVQVAPQQALMPPRPPPLIHAPHTASSTQDSCVLLVAGRNGRNHGAVPLAGKDDCLCAWRCCHAQEVVSGLSVSGLSSVMSR